MPHFLSLILAPIASSAMVPGEVYYWNFEEESISGLAIEGAARTADPDLVISGSFSLLADSRTENRGWNEFIHSRPEEVPLRPDTPYTFSLRYRALAPHGGDVFYLLLRSKTGGPDAPDRWGGTWEIWDNKVHEKNFIIRTGQADDYFLILGIRDEGALVIDDLSIRAGGPAPNGIVRSAPFRYREKLEDWMRSARETGVSIWAETCQNAIDPGGWRVYEGEYRDYLEKLNPDIVAYLRHEQVEKLGFIRTSHDMEYQELYAFDAEKHKIPWEEMVDRFRESGLAVTLDGEPKMDQTWAAGGYYTCHSGENWHRYYLEDLKESLGKFQGLNQDNIGVVGAYKGKGAFCGGCRRYFLDYLRGKYPEAVLREWGVENPETFDLLQFMLKHSLEGRNALRSPLVREYMKAYCMAQLETWMDVAGHVRKWTEGIYPAYGNMIGGMGPIPYAVMLSPWVDVISMEHYWPSADFYEPPRFHCAAWGYKVSRGARVYEKPVFILNALEGHGGAARYRTTVEMTFAEGLANGGHRVYSPGANIPKYGGPHPLEIPAVRALHEDYAAFVRKYRGLFWGRTSANRAAVIYSLPTHLFHHFPPIPGLDDISEYRRFAAACLLMERFSLPYDVIVLPHPEMNPDTDWRERLAGYDLVVFPGVACLSGDQAEAFETYVGDGGRIVAFSPFATHDENYNPVPRRSGLFHLERCIEIEDWDQRLGDDLWKRKDNPEAIRAFEKALDRVYSRPDRPLRGTIPEETQVNFWGDRDGKFFTMHLVNYDWNPEKDETISLENFEIGLDLPEVWDDFSPILIRPGIEEPQPVDFRRENGQVWLTLPRVDVYAIVFWGDRTYLQEKTNYAEAMNLGMRMQILGKVLPERWWEILHRGWTSGDSETIGRYLEEWDREVRAVEKAFLSGQDV